MTTQIKGNDTSTFGGNVDVTGNVKTDNYSFSVYKTADQSVSNSTWTKVSWDAEFFDSESQFDLANNEFVAPVTGYYQINCHIGTHNFSAASANTLCQLNTDSRQYRGTGGYVASGAWLYSNLSHLVYLAAGEKAYMYFYQGSGASQNLQGSGGFAVANFNGYLVRAV